MVNNPTSFNSVQRTARLRRFLLIAFLACVLILIGYFLLTDYNHQIEMAKEQEFKKLSCTVNAVAYSFDGNIHQELVKKYTVKDAIKTNQDDPLYIQLNKHLNEVRKANEITVDMYTLVAKEDADKQNLENAFFFGVTSAERPYFRHTYTPPLSMFEKYEEGGTIGPYTTPNGTWLSAFAPFRDSLNNVVGVIEADADFTVFIQEAKNRFLQDLVFSALIFLAVTGVVLFILQKISNELVKMQRALSQNYDHLNTTYSSITKFAEKIGSGDLGAEIQMDTSGDVLSQSLLKMRDNLKKARKNEEAEIWVTKGMDKLSTIVRQNEDKLKVFCKTILKELVDYGDAQMGIIYLVTKEDEKNPILEESGYVGYGKHKYKKTFYVNEGMIGRVFYENEPIRLQKPPKDYLQIVSGLGNQSAGEILIFPLAVSKQVIGVVEIATLDSFSEKHLEYFEEAKNLMASSIFQRRSTIQTMNLLEEARKRNIELREAYQEMERVRNDALAAKQFAERASNVKSEFLANMSHELRTPLNGVIGYAQILMEAEDLPDQHIEKVRIMHSSGEHLLGLINNVLDISKIEAGKQEIHEIKFELEYFLDDIVKMLEIKAFNKGLRLEYNLDKKLPGTISTDKGKLRQCLINLINNALKFTEEGGVTLDVRKEKDGFIGFHVIDTGIGIPDEKIRHILQPFSQIQEANITEEGTGLGLTITQNFVELMGGKFDIRSRIGHGSTFSILVPLREAKSDGNFFTEKEKVVAGIQGNKDYSILIVDDIEVNRKVAGEILGKIGFEVFEAENGLKGIEMALKHRPDLILGDIRMPVMDGIEMVKQIRRKEEIGSTPTIAITASAEHVKRSEVLASGFDDFIAKPFRLKELLEMVGRHLRIQYTYKEAKSHPKDHKKLQANKLDYQLINQHLPKEFKSQFESKVTTGDLEGAREVALQLLSGIPELSDFLAFIQLQVDEFNFDRLENLVGEIG